jgi:hypothetical protein
LEAKDLEHSSELIIRQLDNTLRVLLSDFVSKGLESLEWGCVQSFDFQDMCGMAKELSDLGIVFYRCSKVCDARCKAPLSLVVSIPNVAVAF